MRLIDADVLIEEFKKWLPKEGSEWLRCGIPPLENLSVSAILTIEEQPTVEAVPVVRCKNCTHWGTGVAGETEHVKCCEYGRYMVGENGYCVYGEKV